MSNLRVHWGLAPGVTHLAAFYDPPRQLLTLSGEGSTALIAHGFEFVRDTQFVGGLAFNFMCWVGPALEKPHKYEWSQNFRVPYVPGIINLDKVLIRTADHPDGEEVEVHWGGIKPSPPQTSNAAPPQQPSQTAVVLPPPIEVNVPLHGTFSIQVDSKSSETIQMKFDPSFMVLQEAGIVDGNLVWKFLANRAGLTTVMVTFGESPVPGSQRIWDVNIGYPVSKHVVIPTREAVKGSEALLGFLGGVGIAVRLVQKQWPNAELYSVDCKLPPAQIYPADNAYEINQLVATFRVGNQGSVKIASAGWWSTWGAPTYREGRIDGNNNIKWPPGEGNWDIGLEDAVELLRADPKAPKEFWSCALQEPQHPAQGSVQPTYTFTMINGSSWSVGAIDSKVWQDQGPTQPLSIIGVSEASDCSVM